MLGQVAERADIVVADFEAGLGTLSRLGPEHLDIVLVVAEPSVKAIEVGRRALALARERGIARTALAVNRVASEADRDLVAREFGDTTFFLLPDDPAVRAADAEGRAPYDAAPQAPAIEAARALVERLVAS